MATILDRPCPCGSGKLRRDCEERELAVCIDCGGFYHHASNRQVRCSSCAVVANKARALQRSREWRHANPEKARAQVARYKARKRAERDAREAKLVATTSVTKSPAQEVLTLL